MAGYDGRQLVLGGAGGARHAGSLPPPYILLLSFTLHAAPPTPVFNNTVKMREIETKTDAREEFRWKAELANKEFSNDIRTNSK